MKIITGLTILLTMSFGFSAFADASPKSLSPAFLAELTQVREMVYELQSGPTWLAKHGSSDTNTGIIHLQANLKILQTMFPGAQDAVGQIVVREMLAQPYDYNRGSDQQVYVKRLYELIDDFLRPSETSIPKWRETPFGKTFLRLSASLTDINMNMVRESSGHSQAMALLHRWGAETKAFARFAPTDILNGKLPEFFTRTGDFAFENAYTSLGGDGLPGTIKLISDAFRKVEKALDDGVDCGELLAAVPGAQLAIEQSSLAGGRSRRSRRGG